MADKAKDIKVGDIVEIKSAYVRGKDSTNKELHLNDKSQIIINPEGKTVDVDISSVRGEYKRKTIDELKDEERNAEVKLTVVQVFEPRFYEICPECGRKLVLQEGGLVCPVHGKVTPKQAYVLNVIGDDGTGTMRLVFFKEQVLKLLHKKEEDLIVYKETPEEFDSLRRDMLGTEIIVKGRSTLNKMFGKKEFIVEDVEAPDYKKEEETLKKKIKEKGEEPENPEEKDDDLDFSETIN